MSDLRIDIAAEFTGKKAFKEADTSAQKLNNTVKTLAKTLGAAYGTRAVINYGKAAVKAFSEDQAAAQRLSSAVDNLGLSMSKTKVADFIANLEKTASIADDVLRPAFQALLTTTGSLTQSQKLLNNAIQISRASGIELSTVAQDLANGYVGITRGLKKYNTGLTQAELKTKSFNDILGIMLARSAGAAQAYLETTAYKLDALTLAGNNAKETIGAGLVDAFAKIGGGSSTADAVKAIDSIAKAINKITTATGFAIGAIVKLYKGLDFLTSFGGRTGANGSIAEYATTVEKRIAQFKNPRSASPAGTYARTKQQRDAEAAAAKRAKELAALQSKQVKASKALTAEQKKQAALKKAGTIFDMDQIQLIAALKGKLSDEDRKRAELQLALLNENDVLATSLTKQILMAQDATGGLYQYFLTIGDAKIKNPFAFLDEWIKNFQTQLNSLKIPDLSQPSTYTGTGMDPAIAALGVTAGYGANIPQTGTPSTVASNAVLNGLYGMQSTAGFVDTSSVTGTNVKVYVSGSVVTEQELVDAIQSGLQSNSLSGAPSQIGRIAGMFG